MRACDQIQEAVGLELVEDEAPPQEEGSTSYEEGDRIQLEAVGLEFVVGGNTIWVQGPWGTVLRIKCSERILVDRCSAPGAHADVLVSGGVKFCVPGAR